MGTLSREVFRSVILVLLCVSWMSLVTQAQADEYQDAITKAFPGFKILSRVVKRNAIESAVPDGVASVRIYQPDSTYLNCVTSD
jgi:4-amino-4-deoxy-L-arabinose transferase-like glycosyltransferase